MNSSSLDGLRAGTLCAFLLTLLSFFGVESALEEASDMSGLLYVATAFGVLGLPCVLFGLAIGALLDLWRQAAASDRAGPWIESARTLRPKHSITLLPRAVIGLLPALVLAATHALVTSKFQRLSFQAIFLGLTMAVTLLGLVALLPPVLGKVVPVDEEPKKPAPSKEVDATFAAMLIGTPALALFFGLMTTQLFKAFAAAAPGGEEPNTILIAALSGGLFGISFALVAPKIYSLIAKLVLSKEASRPPFALTKKVLYVALAAALIVCVGGYIYGSSLGVWTPRTLQMSALMVCGPLLLLALMSGPMKWDRLAWRVGLPLAGLLSALVCFFGAWSWASSDAEMRRAVTKESALLATFTGKLQRFGDADGDGHAGSLGGADCDDSNALIFPGAKDLPVNGVDEDCDGKDASKPSLDNHPVKRAMAAAIKSAQREIKKLEHAAPPEPPKNIVMILVDTLRYDHMGFAGYSRDTSPHIDALAAESIVFEDAYATAPHTPRSIPSLFFGRYASRMDWRGGQYNYPKVKPENLGLFEVLEEKGWENHGFSSHFYFQEKRGMGQGFASWDNEGAGTISESNTDIAAPRIFKKASPKLSELAAASTQPGAHPFSVFIHLFEPHGKWIGHKEHDFGKGETPVERHINNYDSEIAYVDTYIAKIIDQLKREGIYDDTIIVLTSDHGEAFNEHKKLFHGTNLYNEVIKVPLVIRIPGWKPRRLKGPVSLVDVAPTLLDLYGITIPPEFEGTSLLDAMSGEEAIPLHPVYSELLPYTNWKEHHKALIYDDKKLIKIFTSGTSELYDLDKDPGEQENIAREDKESFEKLNTMLSDWINGG